MASLYDINSAIMDCVDVETGEIIDADALDALMIQRDEKIENIALWIKNLTADAGDYEAEEKAFNERKKAALNKAESLKRYLTAALDGEKFTTAKCAVSFRRSESVVIDDETMIPKKFIKETITTKPDKMALKAALKAGDEVTGCSLVENRNISIK